MEKSLFNIEQEFTELANLLLENEGELTDELINDLEINKHELKIKAGGYSKVIKQLKADNSIIDSEIKRLQAEKKKRVNAETRLKTALTNAMNAYGIEKLETPITSISFRKSTSVEIEDIDLLPSQVITIEKKASKKALKSLLSLGEVKGAKLVVNKSIQIK